MLTRADLEASELVRAAARAARESFPDIETTRAGRYQLVIRMIDMMVTDLVVNIDRELAAAAIGSVVDLRRAGRALAWFSPPMARQVVELKDLMNRKLYRHHRVLRMTQKAGRVLTQLFNAYMAEPAQIPPHIAQRMETEGDSTARVIADYIAGMTDRFALDEYRKLFDPDERV
jgi:dGTPase